MSEQKIIAYGSARGFHQKTLDRWLELSQTDQEAMLDLAEALKLGENHFRDFIDWLEEIALRDGTSAGQVLKGEAFSGILSDPRLGRSDRLKCLKDELRRLRFPRLSRIERAIEQKIRDMKLRPRIEMSVPPGLEGGALTIQMKATSYAEVLRAVEDLKKALTQDSFKEIFSLLSGKEKDAEL